MDVDSKQAKDIYNKFANIFFKAQYEYKDRKIISKALFSLLKNLKNKKILDAGCGAGLESKFLAKKGAKVVGIDISEEMINIARENCKGLNVKFFVQDFERTSFKPSKFDMILAVFSVDYKKNLKNVLKEFHRIVKKNGEVVLVVSHPVRKMMKYSRFNYFSTGKHWEIKKWPGKKLKYKRFQYYRTLQEYFNEIVSSKFRVMKVLEPKPVPPKNIKEELVLNGIKFPKTLWYPYSLILKLKK